MAIIQIQDVSKKFQTKDGEIDALKHVTLDIEAGDIYGIIGMSGAGKSTLVRCINHIEVPTEGTVIVQDKDVNEIDMRQNFDDEETGFDMRDVAGSETVTNENELLNDYTIKDADAGFDDPSVLEDDNSGAEAPAASDEVDF